MSMRKIPLLESCLSSSPATSVIQLGHKAFAIQGQCDYKVQLTESPHLDTLTYFVPPRTSNLKDELEKAYLSYQQNDDVFCDAFLNNILLVSESTVDEPVMSLLASWGCLAIFQLPSAEAIHPGPYFFSACGLYSTWRIFPDDKDAFILSTIPTQADPHILRATKSEQKPLAGMRIAIKDLFHLQGVHTGCSNRAYRMLHDASKTSSSAVQSVLDLGGVIVGKTKTVEFGSSQEAIGDWCDYFYPFNSRGDGYIAGTGSSTGSASSLAAYPWLDITLGTDVDSATHLAGGSIRDPAVAHGVYGFRPSHNGQQIPDVVLKVARVLFPKEYHADHEGVQKITEEWVSSLATWLGANKLDVSIEERWSATKPAGACRGFFETFNKTFIDLIYSEFWSYLSDFRRAYKLRFGADPYVCKVTQYLWNEGKLMSDARKKEALDEVSIHNDWFLRHLLVDDQTIIVVPRPPELRSFEGFDSNFHASLSGVPNIIVPIGQYPFYSKVSGREEYFPVSVSIFAPKGKDIGLLNLVHDYMTANSLPTSVMTGRTAFSLD
ncbi:amidase-like protein [Xylaria sp. FL0064]|nr:amidase-like protein [Xylaria sp. FL0064]